MTAAQRQKQIETNTLLLERARWLLEQVHLRLITLSDIAAAREINHIIYSVETERQRWLRTMGTPAS